MPITFVLITFLFQMSVGMVTAVAFLPTSLIDAQFFRSISFWAWFLTGLGLFFWHRTPFILPDLFGTSPAGTLPVTLLLWTFAVLCFQLWFRIRWLGHLPGKIEVPLITLEGLGAILALSLLFRPLLEPAWAQSVIVPLHFLTASLALGGFLAGMIFGHFYLMNVETPKRLLVTMSWILIFTMIFRLLAVGATLLLYKYVLRPDTNFLETLVSFNGHGLFFWERMLAGLLIPSGVVAMIHGTAKIGSNQSATGIMYVAIAFVFMGELIARYLFLLSAIPL